MYAFFCIFLSFSNVLAVSKIANDKYTVVANNGSEYTFTVSVATK